jgi:hypothetical protein
MPHLLSRRKFLATSVGVLAAVSLGGAESARSGPIRLIVRGDDMGFSHSGNEALIKCYREGIETSIEVLAPSPWFPEAMRLLGEKENAGVDVGVHLALTSEWDNVKWRPLTRCPSLVEPDGYFYPMLRPNPNYPHRALAEHPWKIEEIEQEFRAQIELVRKHVPRVSHVSGHMGCTGLAPEVSAMSRRVARELGVDVDLAGTNRLGYEGPKGTLEEKLASFLKALGTMQPGDTYWFVDHPALDTPEARAISHIGYENVATDRQGVTDLWTHPRVKAFIKERGIQLIGYRDLKR